MYKNFFLEPNILSQMSSARQIEEYSKKRNPIIQTDLNTLKGVELIQKILEDNRTSQYKANIQFIITIIISLTTLLFTIVSCFLNF